MLLHVAYQPQKSAKRISVASPDTDWFVLLVYQFSHMGVREIFFETGRKRTHADLTRFIPVHIVVCKLNEEKHTFSRLCLLSQALTLVVHFLA